MPTKNETIANVYNKYLRSRAHRIKSDDKKKSEADPECEPSGITKRDVDHWFLNNDHPQP